MTNTTENFDLEMKIQDWLDGRETHDIHFKIVGPVIDGDDKLMQVQCGNQIMTTHADFWIDLGKELIKYGKKYQ